MEEELWFAPHQIRRFSQRHIIFVLQNWDLFKEGRWPPGDPNDIYTQMCLQAGGYFEAAIIVVAEVEIRLDKTGDDGFILKDRYYKEEREWTLARKYHLPVEEISMRIRRALRYMSGDSRKKIPYDVWVKNGWKEKRLTPSH